ncbi:hypothetical protein [Shewanella algae]|uniref:hypothetical protein n=1 Tax=Shewanella algae TaxID=38313 RepID=UPI003AAFFA3E
MVKTPNMLDWPLQIANSPTLPSQTSSSTRRLRAAFTKHLSPRAACCPTKHAKHHFCVHDSSSHSIFTGDIFGISYKVFDSPAGENLLFVTTTSIHLDPLAICANIERLVALEPKFIYLTHYRPEQPTATNVRQLLASLDAFVAIDEQHARPLESRQQRIAAAILDWLTAQLATINPAADLQQMPTSTPWG